MGGHIIRGDPEHILGRGVQAGEVLHGRQDAHAALERGKVVRHDLLQMVEAAQALLVAP